MSQPELRLRPLRRLSRRQARVLQIAGAIVAVVLVVNLIATVIVDSGASPGGPRRAGRAADPQPMTASYFDDFDTAPTVFPGLGVPWRLTGEMGTRRGVLYAEGPSVAQVAVPPGDGVLQTVIAGPGNGWSVAFGYRDQSNYWAVNVGPYVSTVVQVVAGQAEVMAREPSVNTQLAEIVVIRRAGQVSVRNGPRQLWAGSASEVPEGDLALLALGATRGGIELVAVRSL